MTRSEMIGVIDQEIARLEQVRGLLQNNRDLRNDYQQVLKVGAASKESSPARTMSPEGRARIVEAQRKRWAKQKRQAAAAKRTKE